MWIEASSIMNSCLIAKAEHPMRTRVALLAAGLFALLALALTALLPPATARAYDYDYYNQCQSTLGQPANVCCSNAGGEWSNGQCLDPQYVHPLPTVGPTTQQQFPQVGPAPRP